MSLQSVFPFVFDFSGCKPVVFEVSGARLTSDAGLLGIKSELPAAALADNQRKQFFNRRRDADPLGEGHPCTWRTRLIKVAAEVIVSARRVLVRLSQHWPHLEHLAAVTGQVVV